LLKLTYEWLFLAQKVVLQILDLKKNNVGTVLMVEVGYKYKFFGEDAKVRVLLVGDFSLTDCAIGSCQRVRHGSLQ
jgi:hypothetical protein